MSSPDRTRSAARLAGYLLGTFALLAACSKQERPEVAVRTTTLAARTPASTDSATSAPADTADSTLSFDAAS